MAFKMANSVSFQYFQTVSDCRFSLPTAAYQCCYGNEVVELIQRCHRVYKQTRSPGVFWFVQRSRASEFCRFYTRPTPTSV